jgi:hypothetical protein
VGREAIVPDSPVPCGRESFDVTRPLIEASEPRIQWEREPWVFAYRWNEKDSFDSTYAQIRKVPSFHGVQEIVQVAQEG